MPARSDAFLTEDSGGTTMAEGVTEDACPHMRPCPEEEAMLTAQWHAQLMSAARPFFIFSKAPRFTSGVAVKGVPFEDAIWFSVRSPWGFSRGNVFYRLVPYLSHHDDPPVGCGEMLESTPGNISLRLLQG